MIKCYLSFKEGFFSKNNLVWDYYKRYFEAGTNYEQCMNFLFQREEMHSGGNLSSVKYPGLICDLSQETIDLLKNDLWVDYIQENFISDLFL